MNVTFVNRPPPIGPAATPTVCSLSHATASALTKGESVDVDICNSFAQTLLESRESSHVTRIVPASGGSTVGSLFGLKKCVMSCLLSLSSLNSVASGVNSENATPVADGRHT